MNHMEKRHEREFQFKMLAENLREILHGTPTRNQVGTENPIHIHVVPLACFEPGNRGHADEEKTRKEVSVLDVGEKPQRIFHWKLTMSGTKPIHKAPTVVIRTGGPKGGW